MNQENNNQEIHGTEDTTITDQHTQYNATQGMTYKQWMLTLLLMIIPVANIVLLIIWATGGGNQKERKNFSLACLTWTAISFVLSFVLIFLVVIIGVSIAGNTNGNERSVDSYYQSNQENEEDLNSKEGSGSQGNLINEEPDSDTTYQEGSDSSETEFLHVEAVEIGTDDHPFTAYVLSKGLDVYESFSTGNESGIIHTVSLEDYHESLSDAIDTSIGVHRGIYEGIDAYSDFVLSDKVTGATWEVQQMNYNLTLNGTTYPCFYIVKADTVSDGSFLVNIIDYNASLGDDRSKEVIEELFKVTGIEFDFN